MARFWLRAGFTLLMITFLLKDNITTAQISSVFVTQMTQITNHRSTSGALSELQARGITQCAMECNHAVECRSFFYNKQDTVCQLHDVLFENYDTLTYIYQTRYYIMNEVQSNFTCPPSPPPAEYTAVLLSDNTVFSYRIIWGKKEKTKAIDDCVADGAGLVRVLSLAKMQTLVNLFTTCPGYQGTDNYWIDGSNINAVDFFNITQWETSLSEPLPTTNQFWAPGWPLDPDKDQCAVLSASDGYRWTNAKCAYPSKFYFICEE
ncbi:uncharacterized protein LOC123532157 [Mercenaria mercenaria]|uniref:uncharacterized protein LOC123532157 n=1 Tax=Mercenaria mercenaria TaxID=6596 RepID=UPI00234F5891|nr:uncharacterized protein LOC123532157 [Mercenaria mercenaria]